MTQKKITPAPSTDDLIREGLAHPLSASRKRRLSKKILDTIEASALKRGDVKTLEALKKPKAKKARRGKYRPVESEMDLSSAIAGAMSNLQELRDEVREIVDNASGTGLENTQRIQTFEATADTLDNFADNDPSIPEDLGNLKVKVVTLTARRSISRAVRCSNAVAALEAAKGRLEEFQGESENEEANDRADDLISELDDIIGEADNLEFPGMFG